MRRCKLTPEAFAAIPGMVESGMKKAEIAAVFGVTPATLQVRCCAKRISLRRAGFRGPQKIRLYRLAGQQKASNVVKLDGDMMWRIQLEAEANNMDVAAYVRELLATIVKDNLFRAVLDKEAA